MKVKVRVFGIYRGPLSGRVLEAEVEPQTTAYDLLKKLDAEHGSKPGPFVDGSGAPRDTVRMIIQGETLGPGELHKSLGALLPKGQELVEVLVMSPVTGGQ